jgi:hypothetical protein
MGRLERRAKGSTPAGAGPGAPGEVTLSSQVGDPTTSGTRPRARRTQQEIERVRLELHDRFAAGDYAAALALAVELQEKKPGDLVASSFARDCRRMLEAECVKRTGPLQGIPVLALSIHELQSRSLDHRAGFLVSRVDGQSTLEMLLDLVPLPRIDALRILAELVDQGILRIADDR